MNGVLAAPLMALLMCMTASAKVMGEFVVEAPLRIVGWLATALMACAALALIVSALL